MSAVLAWYELNKRAMPWRDCADPYAVWISEVMLQQTRVVAALPFFERWMHRFPTLETLAGAEEQEVLAAWQGLGYYSRARNLHRASQMVCRDGWPASRAEWRALPGIGDYTSAALSSLLLGAPDPAVDGNVERVFARFRGDERVGPALREAARLWALSIMDLQRPGDSNQALMELGALVCLPRGPKCGECPVAPDCVAFKAGLQQRLPVRVQKAPVEELEHCLAVLEHDGRFAVQELAHERWWRGMWGWPADQGAWGQGTPLKGFRHTVTRHRIHFLATHIRLDQRVSGFHWCTPRELETLPLPAPHRRIARHLS